jgi:phosphomevalonate kinase
MKVRAPGKLVLTGAYAVLDGAPAIVAAVDRYALADGSRRSPRPTLEVRAAFGEGEPAPLADASAFSDTAGRKLGLGSSAAVLVASLGARALARGEDVQDHAVRGRLFAEGRAAHALAQGGGSGVDVAASVYGGVLRYSAAEGQPQMRQAPLPTKLVFEVYFGGKSARTSDLLQRVAAARLERSGELSPVMRAMAETAARAADALESSDALGFVSLAQEYGALLGSLGRAARAPIVLPGHAELALAAEREDAAFFPSGAGGGDVAIWLGSAPPSQAFRARAHALAFAPLALSIDVGGVRPVAAHS